MNPQLPDLASPEWRQWLGRFPVHEPLAFTWWLVFDD